jgi:hypothetical protein
MGFKDPIATLQQMFPRARGTEMYRSVGSLLMLAGFTAAAKAQPVTIRLACEGTTTQPLIEDAKPEPISMGIIVNLTARTVQGFPFHPVKITAADDVTVAFGGSQQVLSSVLSISGSIDRVNDRTSAPGP